MLEINVSYELLDKMTRYMNPDIREDIQIEYTPCTPQKFMDEYLKRDKSPEFRTALYTEYRMSMFRNKHKQKAN